MPDPPPAVQLHEPHANGAETFPGEHCGFRMMSNWVRDGVCGRKLVTSPFLPSESDGRSINKVSDVLRAGSVSARSWGERITTEHTGHTEKRVEG
jgi:hypothetical protein